MPKVFIRVKDAKTKKVYYLQWSTVSDEPNSPAVTEDNFVELHYELCKDKFKKNFNWAKHFALDKIQLGKTNVSVEGYTRKELLECSDEYNTVKSLVQYCKENLKKY